MAGQITLRLDDKEVRRNIKRLGDQEIGRAMAKAMNRTAFEILDAERDRVVKEFPQATPRGKRFLGGRGSFRFDKAKPRKLEVAVFPNPRTGRTGRSRADILAEHAQGAEITPSGERLTVGGKLAIPIGPARLARQKSGRVPARFQPRKLFGEGGRGFVAGNVVFRRKGRKGSGNVQAVFALAESANLEKRDFFFEVARVTANRVWAQKIREEFNRIRFRRKVL